MKKISIFIMGSLLCIHPLHGVLVGDSSSSVSSNSKSGRSGQTNDSVRILYVPLAQLNRPYFTRLDKVFSDKKKLLKLQRAQASLQEAFMSEARKQGYDVVMDAANTLNYSLIYPFGQTEAQSKGLGYASGCGVENDKVVNKIINKIKPESYFQGIVD